MSCRCAGALADPPAMNKTTALFSLLAAKAFFSCRNRAGDCLATEIAFKKARSSCFSIGCKQENILSRINSLTDGGPHSQQRTKLSRALTLAPILFYSFRTEYSEGERPVTSLHFTSLHFTSLHFTSLFFPLVIYIRVYIP
jgi:hypothetical protein